MYMSKQLHIYVSYHMGRAQLFTDNLVTCTSTIYRWAHEFLSLLTPEGIDREETKLDLQSVGKGEPVIDLQGGR
jgi:hypothetical protein